MKNILITGIYFLVSIISHSQKNIDTTVNLDLLKAPTSVAFSMLGIAASDIERPTDLTSFAASIRSATNNFSKLPTSYAIEIAPAWIARMDNLTLDRYNSTRFRDVFWQSFNISLAFTRQDEDGKEETDTGSYSKLGAGLKFSIIRPPWSAKTRNLFDSLLFYQKLALSDFVRFTTIMEANNPELQSLLAQLKAVTGSANLTDDEKRRLIAELAQKINRIKQDINSSYNSDTARVMASHNKLIQAANKFKTERQGPALDFTAGMVTDFPDNRFNYSVMSKAGAWLTGGYEGGNEKISFFGIIRYLYQPDKIFADESGALKSANISTLDGGARLLVKGAHGKFIGSCETIYRSVLNKNTIDPNWRLILNLEYDVGFNQKLTFAFGKNFDGTISKTGNLVAALNFIKAFGAQKRLPENED